MSVCVLATNCNVSCGVTLVAICRYEVWVGRLQSGGSPRQSSVCIPPYTSFCSGPVFVSAVLLSVVPAHASVSRPGPS